MRLHSWLHKCLLMSIHQFSDGKHTAIFDSAPDTQLGRTFPLTGGLGLGGSTRINGGQYTCGVPAEYNSWSQLKGWSYADLKPYFNKFETWIGSEPQGFHGVNGVVLSVQSCYHSIFMENLFARASESEIFRKVSLCQFREV